MYEAADTIPRDVLWSEWRDGLGKAAVWYEKTEGPFLIGAMPSWGDFVIEAYFIWLKVLVGEESTEFREISSWHGGKWAELLHELRRWDKLYGKHTE